VLAYDRLDDIGCAGNGGYVALNFEEKAIRHRVWLIDEPSSVDRLHHLEVVRSRSMAWEI